MIHFDISKFEYTILHLPNLKCLQTLYFLRIIRFIINPNLTGVSGSLIIKNQTKGLKGHKNCPQQGACPVMVLHWVIQGPLEGPCGFRDSARLVLPFCLKNTFFKPSEHYGTRLWSLLYFTKVQGTLMDLHGPPNGP